MVINVPILEFPNLSNPFILYIDGSKEWGCGVALHQEDKNRVKRPILFLFGSLFDAETRHLSTELKTGALVWTLTKLPQYFDDSPFTVITDDPAFKIALQTNTNN